MKGSTYSTADSVDADHFPQLNVNDFVTHHFSLDEFMDAYDVFARAGETGALKVVLTRS